jgi:hypothetical protein
VHRTENEPDVDQGLITHEGIDKVVAFIPELTEAIAVDDVLRWPRMNERPDSFMPITIWPEYNPTITAFIQSLYDNYFVQGFDWSRWKASSEKYVDEPVRVSEANLGICIKLLTLHARMEHFSAGYFVEVLRSGHILAILRRLEALRETVPPNE